MYLLIGADLVPTESNRELFAAGAVQTLLGDELYLLLKTAEHCIFNLEVPLTDLETPIKKCGPNLMAPTTAVNGYAAMCVDILTLANNHILDHDVQGLVSTRQVLDENHITYLGVGNTPEEAAKPCLFRFGNKTVGLYACVEHEFSTVTEDRPGANPFDPLETPDQVQALKARCDYVIVLYHGGKEHYRYPSPDLQKTCRKLVEKGADLVVCQHSHCIGCEEKYQHGHIVYGQGNFLFDHNTSQYWKTSLLIRLDEDFAVSYVPLVKQGNTVRPADMQAAEEIMSRFAERSELIRDEAAVRREYERFAAEMEQEYLSKLLGKSGLFAKILNRLTGGKYRTRLIRRWFTSKIRRRIRNYIECESHRELMIRILDLQDV